MENPLDPIFEEREELMISPTGDGYPNLRTAHFLKPSSTSRNTPVSDLPPLPLSSRFGFSDHEIALQVKFKGRRNPPENWRQWACSLRSRYEPIWEKAGILDAIMISTYKIMRDNDLVTGVAQKWCPETNTFMFSWGEATITLEDMVVLGGYPILGDPCFSPVESDEMRVVLNNLTEAYRTLAKASSGLQVTAYPWMDHFMGTDHELEHEAFLCLWLSWFMYPYHLHGRIGKNLFPIAIHLARGIPVALAPMVLASIYKDLSLMKLEMMKFVEDRYKYSCLSLDLWAPFQFVQLWVWERFPTLRPNPRSIMLGDPRAARWHEVSKIKVGNVRMALDSAGDCFQWRPYASGVSNWQLPKFYREQEERIMVSPGVDKDLESFARCVRVSELVEPGGIAHYLPYRVAMQFGFDQDIPDCPPQFSMDPNTAWSNYNRPIRDNTFYLPARLFESDVTIRYSEWWKLSVMKMQMLPQVESNVNVKKTRSKRIVKTGSIKQCESVLLQELRSINNGGRTFPCSQSESRSTSTKSHGRLRYKSLEEIVRCEVTKRADETPSAKCSSSEYMSDITTKKPKVEAEDETGEIDKVIAVREAELGNRIDKQMKIPKLTEVEKMIDELKQEFGIRS